MSENKLVKSLMNVASVVGLFVIGYGVSWLFDTKPDYYAESDFDTDDDDTEPDMTRERVHVEVNIS